MSMIKILADGRVTIPKHIRDTLGLRAGDVAEAKLEEDRIIITLNFSNRETYKSRSKAGNASAWDELRQVMGRVHEKNRGVSEAEVTADVQRAVAELRQEEYDKETSRCS